MKFKNILITFLVAIMVIMPFSVVNVNAEEITGNKVKVYVFTKDGCGYCELQLDYLDELAKTNDKFETIELRAYDANWGPDAYYNIAYDVSDYFVEKGFENAQFTGTPLVVISDVYASVGYNTDLDSIINDAYEKGDADIVKQISKDTGFNLETGEVVDNQVSTDDETPEIGDAYDKENYANKEDVESSKSDDKNTKKEGMSGVVLVIIIVASILVVAGIITIVIYLIVKSKRNSNKNMKNINEEKEVHSTNEKEDKAYVGHRKTVVCKKCGYENQNDWMFCYNCGCALKEANKPKKTKPTKTTNSTKQTKPTKNSNKKRSSSKDLK